MAHPESDGAAEMLEGAHRAVSTSALRLAELYAQRMQIQARLREQQARTTAAVDQRHAAIAVTVDRVRRDAAAGEQPLPDVRHESPAIQGGAMVRTEAIRDVSKDEFAAAHQQAAQDLGSTGTKITGVDEDAVTRRQFEILESEAFVRAVLDDREGWEARQIATVPDRGVRRSDELAAAEVWLATTAPEDFATYRITQTGPGRDQDRAEAAQENLVNRYESSPTQQKTPAEPTPGYDSTAARSTRATQLDCGGFDHDIIESAMITDLGFGTAAAESVAATTADRRPAAKARSRGDEREHHALSR